MAELSTPKQKLSALIITYNEIGYIEKCIESISFADEIIVVDSFSTDGTYEYLLKHPKVKVIQNPFENFTSQKSFTLKQASNDWVLFLDADEVVTKNLQQEITETINNPNAHEAYWFYRKFMFQNQPLNYSGWQTDKNHRLFRKSKAQFTDKKIVHETLEVDGTSGILNEKLLHFCYKNYEDYKGKMLCYGRLKAKEDFYKEKHFNYLLMTVKPFWKFFNHYIIRLGVLDGKKGLTICFLNALGVLERFCELKRLEKKNELAYYLVMP
ncbi:glycosyltransferase family 2 protein [Flagellimonas zhangzhouensis]|uniref:Glycosyltransferase involved in cell wall bisynthesis n=1 Tax=Flagellimonas zhangzhouensis TaxID=1073328 RepID=A0A1H2R0I5_9FLAO|nr:glycosyltransferase family 2 protein [Allomuricauda zhangzhouensis]SDQ57966.1 Glycosyltransferase involved in cell wall bisynthesis [Allomuricauda zhangzhouensis]SDW12179.1 Glycosyltransferase involved in cell wall bisynthesis [Allomuricauda zhangzhouensis]